MCGKIVEESRKLNQGKLLTGKKQLYRGNVKNGGRKLRGASEFGSNIVRGLYSSQREGRMSLNKALPRQY